MVLFTLPLILHLASTWYWDSVANIILLYSSLMITPHHGNFIAFAFPCRGPGALSNSVFTFLHFKYLLSTFDTYHLQLCSYRSSRNSHISNLQDSIATFPSTRLSHVGLSDSMIPSVLRLRLPHCNYPLPILFTHHNLTVITRHLIDIDTIQRPYIHWSQRHVWVLDKIEHTHTAGTAKHVSCTLRAEEVFGHGGARAGMDLKSWFGRIEPSVCVLWQIGLVVSDYRHRSMVEI